MASIRHNIPIHCQSFLAGALTAARGFSFTRYSHADRTEYEIGHAELTETALQLLAESMILCCPEPQAYPVYGNSVIGIDWANEETESYGYSYQNGNGETVVSANSNETIRLSVSMSEEQEKPQPINSKNQTRLGKILARKRV